MKVRFSSSELLTGNVNLEFGAPHLPDILFTDNQTLKFMEFTILIKTLNYALSLIQKQIQIL